MKLLDIFRQLLFLAIKHGTESYIYQDNMKHKYSHILI
jgi:hypothetical protein